MTRFNYPDPPHRVESDPGIYYVNKRVAAEHWGTHLEEARERGAPQDEIQWLEGKLEDARYVGD
jgi:hypothetical protein